MKETENQLPPDDQASPHRLDYESRNLSSAKRPWKATWGVVSFSSMVLWFPGMGCAFLIVWTMLPEAPGGGPSSLAGVIMMTAYFLPLIMALASGLYSIKLAGIALRNILGVIGFISSAVVLLFTAYRICVGY